MASTSEIPQEIMVGLLKEHAKAVATITRDGSSTTSGCAWIWKCGSFYFTYDETTDELRWRSRYDVDSVGDLLQAWKLTEVTEEITSFSAKVRTDALIKKLHPIPESEGEWVVDVNGVPVRFPDKIRISEEKKPG